jgi:hypothetical protein
VSQLASGSEQAWEDYVAAARRLATVRRAAAAAAAEQQAAARAAGEELAYVRGRLALQQREWPAAGVAVADLATTPADLAGAGAIGRRPADVLDALRRCRSILDGADALVIGGRSRPGDLAGRPPPVRNLFVYGPLAFFVLITQLVIVSLLAETPIYLPLCGLVLPAAAFGLGYVAVGLVFPAPPGGRVDRTPVLGALVCLASVVLLCAGMGVLAALR